MKEKLILPTILYHCGSINCTSKTVSFTNTLISLLSFEEKDTTNNIK